MVSDTTQKIKVEDDPPALADPSPTNKTQKLQLLEGHKNLIFMRDFYTHHRQCININVIDNQIIVIVWPLFVQR